MGQAFDEKGNVLGEAFGGTMGEVAEKLEREHRERIARMEIERLSESVQGEPLLRFFEFDHLPSHLARVSGPFCELARQVVETIPRNPERAVALRKLLEAKDCAVRAVL